MSAKYSNNCISSHVTYVRVLGYVFFYRRMGIVCVRLVSLLFLWCLCWFLLCLFCIIGIGFYLARIICLGRFVSLVCWLSLPVMYNTTPNNPTTSQPQTKHTTPTTPNQASKSNS